MASWLRPVLNHPILRSWPRFSNYVLERNRGELRLRGTGSLMRIDVSEPLFPFDLSADWLAGRVPRTAELDLSLHSWVLGVANRFGLTAPGRNAGGSGKWAPASTQSAAEFHHHISLIGATAMGWEEGMLGSGFPNPTQRAAYEQNLEKFVRNHMFGDLLAWRPTEAEHEDPADLGHFVCRRVPTLFEIAMCKLIQLAEKQARDQVQRCANPDCRKLFTEQLPRAGQLRKAWTRADVLYCSHACGKHASYLRTRERRRTR